MKLRTAFLALLPLGFAAVGVSQPADEPIQPIRPAEVTRPALVELGKKLFFEPRLSRSGFISCNSCHNLSMGGSDNLQTSIGDHWQRGPINSPTVLNSSMSLAQFWDGRAKDLKEQAGGPIANPGEMAFSHPLAIEVIASIPQYREEFARAFGPGPVDIDKVKEAIAAFEETLVTPNSRFDRWLQGEADTLSAQELAGYQLFKEVGCVRCHNGPAAGGTSFQKMGVVSPYVTPNPAQGRVAVTHDEFDELTYPYFHDGAVTTLSTAVATMGAVQLGNTFTPEETAAIVAFLKSMTGDQPRFEMPILPPSTPETPRPVPFG
jgi:cytochrome c peroxidase